jgi:hypothetical protein
MVWLLSRYSDSYASNQYRALQQFFRWQSEEVDLPDPMARLRAPIVRDKLIPVFTSGELPDLEKACQGRTFAQRRDYAIMAVFRATGIRLSELAGIRYDPGEPLRSGSDGSIRPHQDGLKWLHSADHWTAEIAPVRAAARRKSRSGAWPD